MRINNIFFSSADVRHMQLFFNRVISAMIVQIRAWIMLSPSTLVIDQPVYVNTVLTNKSLKMAARIA